VLGAVGFDALARRSQKRRIARTTIWSTNQLFAPVDSGEVRETTFGTLLGFALPFVGRALVVEFGIAHLFLSRFLSTLSTAVGGEWRALVTKAHRLLTHRLPVRFELGPESLGKVRDEVHQLEFDETVHATRLLGARKEKILAARAARVLLTLRTFHTTSRRIVERLGAVGAIATKHGMVSGADLVGLRNDFLNHLRGAQP
jgi:hypothetical protein